jgi:hypothetical protein
MLRFLLRAVLVLGLSAGGAWLLWPFYLGMSALVAICCFAILLTRAWKTHEQLMIPQRETFDENEMAKMALDFFYRFVLALAIGAIWPGLPVMLWRGGAEREASPIQTNSH